LQPPQALKGRHQQRRASPCAIDVAPTGRSERHPVRDATLVRKTCCPHPAGDRRLSVRAPLPSPATLALNTGASPQDARAGTVVHSNELNSLTGINLPPRRPQGAAPLVTRCASFPPRGSAECASALCSRSQRRLAWRGVCAHLTLTEEGKDPTPAEQALDDGRGKNHPVTLRVPPHHGRGTCAEHRPNGAEYHSPGQRPGTVEAVQPHRPEGAKSTAQGETLRH
jgi:hypothetical protein